MPLPRQHACRLTCIAPAAAALAIAGCGSDPAPHESVRASLRALHLDMKAGKAEEACASMGASARRQAAAQTTGRSCEQIVDALARQRSADAARLTPIEIARVERGAGSATAVLPTLQEIRLSDGDDRWVPELFFLESQRGVSVGDASNDREIARTSCGRVDASSTSRLRGGCVGRVRGEDFYVSFATVGGIWTLGGCAVELRVRVDARGHNWLDSIALDGDRCDDIRPCSSGGRPLAWEGQFHWNRPGQVHNHQAVCLDTPLGRVEGPISTTWTRDRKSDRWSLNGWPTAVGGKASAIGARWAADLGALRFRGQREAGR